MQSCKRLMTMSLAVMLAAILSIGAFLPPSSCFALPAAPRDSAFAAYRAEVTGFHKVLAAPGVLDPTQSGITLWHDYGAFALYRVTPEAFAGLSPRARAEITLLDEANQLALNAYPFDTQRDDLTSLPTILGTGDITGASLHLIQFVGPIKGEWLEEVTAAGAQIVHYIPNYSYLVWADASARANLDALAREGNILQFSAPYQSAFKMAAPLYQRLAATEDATVEVVIQIYNHRHAAATRELVQKLFYTKQSMWSDILVYQNAYGTLHISDLPAIAARPDVVWVGERLPRQLYDEVQDQILAGNLDAGGTGPSGAGYLTWLADHGFSTTPSDYPVVDIVDDGIGNGATDSGDNTLHYLGDAANASRLTYVSNCTSDLSGDGVGGHGHINTSIVGGYDNRTGFPFLDPGGYLRGVGVSPYGRMAGTKIFANSGWYDVSACGFTDTGVIKHSQDLGAQITSNSWGASTAGGYDDSSQAYDVGVRDADLTEPGHQQLIMFFAAGNDGSSSSTVGSPGTAKNVITVGASENDRPSDEDGAWSDGCGIGSTGANNAMDIISFSSRGPAEGSRVKPEIVAPGTHIQGAASTSSGYAGNGVCDQYHPSAQTEFAASSGTSHSTPALAGVGSLTYYWLENEYGITPSPAMMKAYIIAHPTYLTGVSANDTLPSNNQGYGMPNMGLAFGGVGRYLLDQSHLFDSTGQTWSHDGEIADPTSPVRVVLAYSDAPGSLSGDPQVNDLDLRVTIGGQTYRGNVFSGQWSVPGGSADANNNYEAIFLPAGATGAMQITVTAANIAGDGVPDNGDSSDQDFALVVYNATGTAQGWLEGQITASASGAPIADATIAASSATFSYDFSSDTTGTYSDRLAAGAYTLTVSAAGYVPGTFTDITISEGITTTQDAILSVAPNQVLSGTVRDANTGWPLYAAISVAGYAGNPIYTNSATGAYSVSLPGYAVYDAAVTSLMTGYLSATGAITLSRSGATRDFSLQVDAANCTAPGYQGAVGFSEAFENATFPPPGWASHNLDGGGAWWQRNTVRAYSGAASAVHEYSTAVIEDGWLRTPAITLASSPELRFWENVIWADWYVTHSLYLCTTGCDSPPANYTQIVEYDNPTEDTWVQRVTDLSAYGGQTVVLAFRYQGYDATDWYIDDVSIPPACIPTAGGLVVGAVSDLASREPLNGVTVANSTGYTTTTATLAGPAGAGFYYLFGPPGETTMTAALTGYPDAADEVTITAGATLRHDIGLALPVYVITPTVGAGGSIIPSTPQTVTHGGDLGFTITPDSGYYVQHAWADDQPVGRVNVYTFTTVTADHTLSATFVAGQTVPVDGATIAPASGTTITFGSGAFADSVVIVFAPQPMTDTDSLRNVGIFYELTAHNLSTGEPVALQPGQTYTITVGYRQEDVPAGVDEAKLALYFRDGAAWAKEPTSLVDTLANTITASPNHFSLWGALSDPASTLYLPAVIKGD